MDEMQFPTPIPEEKPKGGFAGALLDYVEILAFSVIAVLLIFSFFFRLCRVDGRSMQNTLQDGEMLITSDLFYEPEAGDIVIFHLVNSSYQEPLVKRVIATEGQTILIDLTAKEVYVDGELTDDSFVYLDSDEYRRHGYFDNARIYEDERGHLVFRDTVPAGKLFVMGDNRNHSTDSRVKGVGFIDKDCILGKALFRVSPFTVFD